MIWLLGIAVGALVFLFGYLLGMGRGFRRAAAVWVHEDDEFVAAQREHFPWQ